MSVVGQIERHKVTKAGIRHTGVFGKYLAAEPGHSFLASADTAALAKSTLDIIKQHEEY